MLLNKIEIKNFRLFNELDASFTPGLNIIYGKNGQGKTSLLEAIYYLSLTKSFRVNTDNAVLKKNAKFFEIKGTFILKSKSENEIRLFFSPRDGKHVFFNGNKLNAFSELVGQYPVVLLSLENLEITNGLPTSRRKFTDILLSQVSPVYLKNLQLYKKAVAQKNNLLNNLPDNEMLELWNDRLVEYGSIVLTKRLEFINFINKNVTQIYTLISGKEEKIKVSYKTPLELNEVYDETEIKKIFKEKLVDQANNEIKRQTSLIGPHRDDLEFYKNDDLFKSHGSLGECKTFLISLKNIEISFLHQKMSTLPLFMLDDVFGELDDSRIKNLIHFIKDMAQTFITTTDKSKFKDYSQTRLNIMQLKDKQLIYETQLQKY